MATVLVLGGTGFIGRNLCEYLLKTGAVASIRCVDKVFPQTAFLNGAHTAVFANPAVQFVQGNLSNAGSIAKCFARDDGKEFDYVFNCAAETKYGQDEPIYQEKLHDVCIKIATEAVKHPIKKFVHLSTAQIYAAGKKPSKEGDKTDPWTMLAKAHLKTEADLKAMKGLPLIILRPSTVYGPGDVSGIAPRLICAAVYKHLKEKMKFMWSGDLRLSTVHVRDVAAAMWHCACNVPVGALYNLADKNDTDQAKINKILEAIFGISTGFYGSIMSNAARLNFKDVVEDVNDKHLKPWSEMCTAAGIASTPLTPYLDPELLYNNSFSVDGSAIEATGFKYSYPNVTEELVREMMQYYVEQNLFPVEK